MNQKLGEFLRPAQTPIDGEARAAMLERAVVLRADVQKIFYDCAHWNATNPTEPPN